MNTKTSKYYWILKYDHHYSFFLLIITTNIHNYIGNELRGIIKALVHHHLSLQATGNIKQVDVLLEDREQELKFSQEILQN